MFAVLSRSSVKFSSVPPPNPKNVMEPSVSPVNFTPVSPSVRSRPLTFKSIAPSRLNSVAAVEEETVISLETSSRLKVKSSSDPAPVPRNVIAPSLSELILTPVAEPNCISAPVTVRSPVMEASPVIATLPVAPAMVSLVTIVPITAESDLNMRLSAPVSQITSHRPFTAPAASPCNDRVASPSVALGEYT